MKNQKGTALVPLLFALVAILAGATGYFVFVKKSAQAPASDLSSEAPLTGDEISDLVNSFEFNAPVFVDSGYQLIYRKELDFDGDGIKEVAILTFNPQAQDEPNCKGYCDIGYLLKVLKIDSGTNKFVEIYRDDLTRHESKWDKFETIQHQNSKRESLLFSYYFVRTHSEYILQWEDGKVVKKPLVKR